MIHRAHHIYRRLSMRDYTESTIIIHSPQFFVGSSPINLSSMSAGNLHHLVVNNLRQQSVLSPIISHRVHCMYCSSQSRKDYLSPYLGFKTLSTSSNLSVPHELGHDHKLVVKICPAVLFLISKLMSGNQFPDLACYL